MKIAPRTDNEIAYRRTPIVDGVQRHVFFRVSPNKDNLVKLTSDEMNGILKHCLDSNVSEKDYFTGPDDRGFILFKDSDVYRNFIENETNYELYYDASTHEGIYFENLQAN